eukprot:TRINITY_DN90857_c0_g1_i1.p1 TRINITY_DN90857_c0_g1~~TRINITY_DN90857_c0_g1_i1.p1  ORF type:complete len:608 (-),score=163.62 TRINITY_DN90857_c0_g1_i1:109-1932(-)
MAATGASKRTLSGGSSSSKRARSSLAPAPLCLEKAWGYLADDVGTAVDWTSLADALDAYTAKTLWELKASSEVVREALPLKASGSRTVSLSDAVDGGDLRGKARTAAAAADAPPGQPLFVLSSKIALRDSPGKGRGWFASETLPAGTVLLAERPVSGILDKEWRDRPWGLCDSADTTALAIRLAQNFSPSVAKTLRHLHPQDGQPLPDLQGDDGSEEDEDGESAALEEAIEEAWSLPTVEGLSESQKARLRAVVRLNSLGFYTHSELLCHHGNFSALTGSGLFALASGFNHSCDPSVARFSYGDVTVFVTNRELSPESELSISYIEAEMLCAPLALRRQGLNRDFQCGCPKCMTEAGQQSPALRPVDAAVAKSDHTDEGTRPRYISMDAQVQAQLNLMQPAERVEAVEAALHGGLDEEGDVQGAGESEGGEEEKGPCVLLGKDAQELRVVKATTLMQLKRFEEAVDVWRQLAAFTCHHCPPFDEGLAVYAAQAALCMLSASSSSSSSKAVPADARVGLAAADYVSLAATAHRAMSGVAALFRRRYRLEVEKSFVSDEVKASFWALVDAAPTALRPWADVVKAWKFSEEEIPSACTMSRPQNGADDDR